MQISLLFVMAFATFGNCKKSQAKSAGYLIHKKGHKKGATYLKMKKSHRKSKFNLITHDVEPKEQGEDYDHIDDLDTVAKKEKWLLDMWNEAWERLKAEGKMERAKPEPEAELDPNSQEAKWQREWDILMDAILGPASTNEAEVESSGEKIVEEYKDEALDRARFFIRPQHRRRGVKWIQTTKETDRLFLMYKMRDDIQETMFRVMKKKSGQQMDDKSCNETFRCFMTTPSMTTMTTAMPGVTTTKSPQNVPKSTPPKNKVETFLNTFLRDHLKEFYKHSKGQALHNEQGGVQVDRDDDIQCDPNQR